MPSGFRFSAKAVTRIVKGIRKVEGIEPQRPVARGTAPRRDPDPRWPLTFRNTESSETMPGYALIAFSTENKPSQYADYVLQGGKPTTAFKRFYGINGPEPVAAGAYGKCTIFGFSTPVLYDAGSTPAINQSWGAKASEWSLFPNRPGFNITGVPENGRVTVVQEPVNSLRVTLDGTLSIASSVTASLTDSAEMDITVWDYLLDTGYEQTSGDAGKAEWLAGKWYLTQTKQCSVEV